MATNAFYIKQNDTSPAYRVTLKDGNGDPVDVTAATIRFHMMDADGTVKVDAAGSIVTAASGIVEYEWSAADTDTVGTYRAEFEVTYSDGTIGTFPNSSYNIVKIFDDIA